MVETSFQMLEVLEVCNREEVLTSFNNDKSAFFSGEKKSTMKNSRVTIFGQYAKKL